MSDTNGIVVHPATGEILDPLAQVPPERLAEILHAVGELQTRLKEFGVAVEDELRGRMEARGRRVWVLGDYGLELEARNESVWDPDELEATLRQLVDDGVVNAGELTGIIRHEITVSRSDANRLVGKLTGAGRDAVERCRTWQRKGPGRVKVVQQVALTQGATPNPEDT